jgi:hypothetical protein
MRYCSARRIDPESVDDGTLEAYWRCPPSALIGQTGWIE